MERKLNKLDGVSASVDDATETAKVTSPAEYEPRDLVTTVEQTGYGAALPTPAQIGGADPGTPTPARS
ncbi:heavy metal-associated domain-containing protein [Brachybacterium sp. P6-10-X1]|uniref:heavy metal-associated domain-containing protein n=1 Tax=Brachybacterium sp. P6-10-X1 TaxID=1903186 RepID=UPI0009F9D690|nr:heavy metal-associated domain-containing protein [Brachybacterium sp. P6-10-X1]